jgi:hypothetical protein
MNLEIQGLSKAIQLTKAKNLLGATPLEAGDQDSSVRLEGSVNLGRLVNRVAGGAELVCKPMPRSEPDRSDRKFIKISFETVIVSGRWIGLTGSDWISCRTDSVTRPWVA